MAVKHDLRRNRTIVLDSAVVEAGHIGGGENAHPGTARAGSVRNAVMLGVGVW
jgi:hypothetical protein